ncbi:MAG: hypothetical protein P9M14_10855 [Candidatus Alcyoniella australis]|nr:hypothetical protein [Candidatus Alcyoniella australis]
MRLLIRLTLICALTLCLAGAVWADESGGDDEDGDNDDDGASVEDLERRVSRLEQQNKRLRGDSQTLVFPNGWQVKFEGELRNRALIEANTLNNYENFAGVRVYAYDKRSTFKNDYGWWDMRFVNKLVVDFGYGAELGIKLQLGDIVWGSHAPVYGLGGSDKFDQVTLQFRELYARWSIWPIPLYMEAGRTRFDLGHRMLMGGEFDGVKAWYQHEYFNVGFWSARQYEGENYEMSMQTNDDEDTFVLSVEGYPAQQSVVGAYGWINDWKVVAQPSYPDPSSPLYLLPAFEQDLYTEQNSQQWDVGVWTELRPSNLIRIKAQYDHQFGKLIHSEDYPDQPDIEFKGFAGFAKLDFLWSEDRNMIFLAGGYGSGDDPDTVDYEGFFAPDNRFGIYEEGMDEYAEHGYFAVYEHLSPGAGVPGRLKDDLGSGGVENTIWANVGWDSSWQANHHYYVSVGYIQAARENPYTDSALIGIENDVRIDYLFSNNVVFSIYGGHLFIIGDYFRNDAHDAAQLYFEWKLLW